MATHSTQTIYLQLKSCLHKITGFEPSEILADDDLAAKFKYGVAQKRNLAEALNRCFRNAGMPFKNALHPSKTVTTKTVRDVFNLCRKALGS